MITNEYVIDGLREMIRQISDDSVFTDEFLFYNLNNARIQVMRQYINDKKHISPWLYQRFCIKLCPSTFVECNCQPFPFACTVWRSENPIPKPLTHNTGYIAEFSELNGELITGITENESRFMQYRKVRRKMNYIIGDVRGEKYLFIFSEVKPPKYIKVNMIAEDPTAVEYSACTEEECPEPLGNGFPVEPHLLNSIYRITLEMMGLFMAMTDDRSNNSESVYKGFRGPRQDQQEQEQRQ